MELYLWGVKPAARILGKGTGLAYHGAKELYYYQQDRRNPFDPLSRRAIPAAAFVPGSPAYNRLTVPLRDIVDRYLPGGPAYNALNGVQRARVDARNRTREAILDDTRPMRPYLRQLPIPYLRGYIRDRVEPDYHHRFDPNRRYKYVEQITGTEAMRETMWGVRQILQGGQDRFNEIMIPGVPGGAPGVIGHPHWAALALANHDLVRRELFNMEAENGSVVKQMQVSMRKKYSACKYYKMFLGKHMREMAKTGRADYESIYKQILGIFLGKNVGEAWENEPIVENGRRPGAPIWA